MGRRQIDRHRRGRPARRRIDRERAGVSEQVEESLAGGRLADHPPGDAVIEEQARVDVVGQVDLEAESALGDDLGAAFLGDALVLRRAALALAPLEKNVGRRNLQHLAGGPLHQVEPIGVLGGRVLVGPLELGDVQAVFVAIDHQRHLRDVALVKPVAGDAQAGRPAAEVPGPLGQPAAEDFRLLPGLGRQAAEGRLRLGGRGVRLGPEKLVIGALDAAVVKLPPPVGLLSQQGLEIGMRGEHVKRPGLQAAEDLGHVAIEALDVAGPAQPLAVGRIADDAAMGTLAVQLGEARR